MPLKQALNYKPRTASQIALENLDRRPCFVDDEKEERISMEVYSWKRDKEKTNCVWMRKTEYARTLNIHLIRSVKRNLRRISN